MCYPTIPTKGSLNFKNRQLYFEKNNSRTKIIKKKLIKMEYNTTYFVALEDYICSINPYDMKKYIKKSFCGEFKNF